MVSGSLSFNAMNNNPIGFFDSGVGLFSILKVTKKILPKENFVIFADQGHNPYGEKSPRSIKKYVLTATNFLIKKHQIKMLVLACNTATVWAVGYLRKKFAIPIVGTVPAVKPAFAVSEKAKVAIMCTPATARSRYLDNLVKDFGQSTHTLKVGCAGLEEAIEYLNDRAIKKTLDFYLAKVKKFNPHVVVLGCTHYPLVKNRIRQALPKVKIIDSGQAIARRISDVLARKNWLSKKKVADVYYTTGDPQVFSKVTAVLLRSKIAALKAHVS